MKSYLFKNYFSFLTLLFFTTLLTYANSSNFGYVPKDWYQHPEDQEQVSTESFVDGYSSQNNMMKLSQSLQSILNAKVNVLNEINSTRSKEWNLSNVRTSLAIGAKGLIGILSLKGMSALKLYWRPVVNKKKRVEANTSSVIDVPAEVVVGSDLSKKDMLKLIKPTIDRALATGKIRNKKKFETSLIKTTTDFHHIAATIGCLERSSQWWVRCLLLELYVTASGELSPFTTVGAEIRLRFRWQRVSPILSSSNARGSHPNPCSTKNQLNQFIYTMANDLDSISTEALSNSGYRARYFRIGLGVGVKGNILVAKSKAKTMFYLFFERSKKSLSTNNSRLDDKNSHIEVISNKRQKDLTFAKSRGITYIDNYKLRGQDLSKPTENVIYKVKRETFRKGLNRAFSMAKFFLDETQKIPTKKWELFQIETQFEISITGSLGLASLSGLGATRVYFYKDKG
jgi:hypothetical protein